MYLCICKAVTDQHVRQAFAQGVRTMGDLSARFGVGIECGKCIDPIREVLDACLAAPPAAADAVPMLADAATAASAAAVEPTPPPAVAEPAPQRAAWFAIDL
jgi:bacterioferritin-associated ferredoxin